MLSKGKKLTFFACGAAAPLYKTKNPVLKRPGFLFRGVK